MAPHLLSVVLCITTLCYAQVPQWTQAEVGDIQGHLRQRKLPDELVAKYVESSASQIGKPGRVITATWTQPSKDGDARKLWSLCVERRKSDERNDQILARMSAMRVNAGLIWEAWNCVVSQMRYPEWLQLDVDASSIKGKIASAAKEESEALQQYLITWAVIPASSVMFDIGWEQERWDAYCKKLEVEARAAAQASDHGRLASILEEYIKVSPLPPQVQPLCLILSLMTGTAPETVKDAARAMESEWLNIGTRDELAWIELGSILAQLGEVGRCRFCLEQARSCVLSRRSEAEAKKPPSNQEARDEKQQGGQIQRKL